MSNIPNANDAKSPSGHQAAFQGLLKNFDEIEGQHTSTPMSSKPNANQAKRTLRNGAEHAYPAINNTTIGSWLGMSARGE